MQLEPLPVRFIQPVNIYLSRSSKSSRICSPLPPAFSNILLPFIPSSSSFLTFTPQTMTVFKEILSCNDFSSVSMLTSKGVCTVCYYIFHQSLGLIYVRKPKFNVFDLRISRVCVYIFFPVCPHLYLYVTTAGCTQGILILKDAHLTLR